jgi:RepB DNA-primase from phage plasmid
LEVMQSTVNTRPCGRGGPVPSPAPPPTVKYIGRVTLMDKTESTVRNMLTAIEAPLYDIGVLSDRGMLPGLDGIPAAAVLDRLSLLKYRNVRGSDIYIRPSGEHRFTALDDLNGVSLANCRRMVSSRVRWLRPALATFRPGSSTR